MGTMEGRVALVSGAGRGIGKTIARVLAQQGMLVAINDINPAAAEAAAQEICAGGCRAIAVPADISNKAQVQAMVERVERELGTLWLMVNNAGVFNAAPTAELS